MADHAISDDPAVQAQLDRLASLSPGADILGLERITTLLERLGNPHLSLPPQFHVAGTNGKGSTCAFLRAALEADGKSVHVYTSPHLVRFNERIRVNGRLVSDALLAATLERVLDVAADIGASFFEVTTAAAFLLFAEHPADACIIEVGLGGRLDATNVLPAPAVCGIAQLGVDHQAFLGDDIKQIAGEKAGIAKPGVPLVTLRYETSVAGIIGLKAADAKAHWLSMGALWDAAVYRDKLHYRDETGRLELPLPRLTGPHQPINCALAVAMLRHQEALLVSETALRAAPLWATWPGRLQMLGEGPFRSRLGQDRAIWIDGGHNPDAGAMLAKHFARELPEGEKLDLLIGMLANKDVRGFLEPLLPHIRSIHALPIPRHASHEADVYEEIAQSADIPLSYHADLITAADAISARMSTAPLLIGGSLYLIGEVLKENGQFPD